MRQPHIVQVHTWSWGMTPIAFRASSKVDISTSVKERRVKQSTTTVAITDCGSGQVQSPELGVKFG